MMFRLFGILLVGLVLSGIAGTGQPLEVKAKWMNLLLGQG